MASRKASALLRHDRTMMANQVRFALSSWSDRLIATAMAAGTLAAIRSALSDRPFTVAAITVAALAAAAGAATAQAIVRRLAYHAQDGVLAAEALVGDARRRYGGTIHLSICAAVIVIAAIVRSDAAMFVPVGYLAGAGILHVARGASFALSPPRWASPTRAIRQGLRHPVAGVVATGPVIMILLLSGSVGAGAMSALAGVTGITTALLLTMLDYPIIRFLSEAGYSTGRTIAVHARPLLMFGILGSVAALALADGLVAMVMAGSVSTALILMTARICAYRIHAQRTADLIVGICVGIVCVAGIAAPIVLPVVVIAVLWHLHGRARRVTWLTT